MKQTYKICIEAFVRWEQLTKRSFTTIDFGSVEDLHRLLYCAYIVNGVTDIPTYDVFANAIEGNRRLYAQAIKDVVRYNDVVAQFSAQRQEDSASDTPQAENMMLGDVVARLVVAGGIDAHYAMREMSIEDMLLFVKALDDKQRQEAESQRLWAYISVAPHIDTKKTPSPQKLYPFPWEQEAMRKQAAELAASARAEFEDFMRSTPKTNTKNGKQ